MNLTILDSGFVSAVTARVSQTQLADADRAGYTGSDVQAITLKANNLTRGRDVKVENKPIINTLTDVSTSIVSTANPLFNVSIIQRKRLDTGTFDTNDLVQLFRMESTKGLKLLYPSATTDTDKTIIEGFGAVNTNNSIFSDASPSEDAGTVSTTTPHLIGRIRNMNITDASGGDYWRITFSFEVSG